LKKSKDHMVDDGMTAKGPAPDRESPEPRAAETLPGGKVRVSADIRSDLYRKLRVHIAMTGSRINTFVEEMIERNC
jgi:hypothetical protein